MATILAVDSEAQFQSLGGRGTGVHRGEEEVDASRGGLTKPREGDRAVEVTNHVVNVFSRLQVASSR